MEQDPWADTPSSPAPASTFNHQSSPKQGESSTSSPSRLTQFTSGPGFDDDNPTPPKDGIPEEEGFGASSSSTIPPPVEGTSKVENEEGEEFDDFDDFDAPSSLAPEGVGVGVVGDDDDGFGDFGDFEEGDGEGTIPVLGDEVVEEPEIIEEKLQTLRLNPLPRPSELISQLESILSPLFASSSTSTSSSQLTEEPIRQVGGISQILVAESSRDAYAQMTTPPLTKTLDWTRSRVRREHLISMGVPVNLDEVDSHRLTALPPLRINTANMPPPRKAYSHQPNGSFSSSSNGKGKERDRDLSPNMPPLRSAGAIESPSNGKYGLGDEPVLDMEKVEKLCGLEEDGLSIMSLANLKLLQDDLVAASAGASSHLAWLLQLKDAQTQDSATYNGMISELIANAAKAKQSQNTSTGGGVFRRGSQRRPASMLGGSGSNTPRRVGSPAV